MKSIMERMIWMDIAIYAYWFYMKYRLESGRIERQFERVWGNCEKTWLKNIEEVFGIKST